MTTTPTTLRKPQRPLRLWPGVVSAAALLVFRLVVPVVSPEATVVGLIGAAVSAVAIVVWWVLFSRASWPERIGVPVLLVAALLATSRLVHPSIALGGMGVLFYVLAVPVVTLALVVWATATRGLSAGSRRVWLVASVFVACGLFTLVRTGGVTSSVIGSELHWRWTPTPEERLLAEADDAPAPPIADEAPAIAPAAVTANERPVEPVAEPAGPPAATTGAAARVTPDELVAPVAPVVRAEWPGFRGPGRDGVVRAARVGTDWAASPPVEIWRRPIGPGWSSVAVRAGVLYTQEQRGDEEIVAAYLVATGEPVWRHRDPVRFWESNGGAGPRATPTLSGGRVYSFGATGVVNALDAATGALLWSRNAATDTGRVVPDWGFASSPLVYQDLVIVAVSGTLAAYDLATGAPRWVGPQHGGSYSSPQLATMDGVEQVLLLSAPGAVSVSPADGALLWEHTWEGGAIVQPAVLADGDVVISAQGMTGGLATRRLHVTSGPAGWQVEERWTSRGLKPYFNDFVVHGGHAYGFDGSILACIDLQDGNRVWKGGRYGNGQLILLADQDLLLVLSEEGELALIKAAPDQFTELARFPAIDGKTWNHPVLVGDILLVRNGEEMAAFRLSTSAYRDPSNTKPIDRSIGLNALPKSVDPR